MVFVFYIIHIQVNIFTLLGFMTALLTYNFHKVISLPFIATTKKRELECILFEKVTLSAETLATHGLRKIDWFDVFSILHHVWYICVGYIVERQRKSVHKVGQGAVL